jgi:hypothetical protein
MQTLTVGSGINCNCADVHFLTGSDNTKRNLSAVGDQDFFEHNAGFELITGFLF